MTSVDIDDSEQGGKPTADYYDMLAIGRTGIGKSSTVDKLLVPNNPLIRPAPPKPQRQVYS